MPLYEYECDNGHRFEKIQKFSDPPLEACERCGAPAHKLMSSPAIQFKGTGWYITDYAKKDSKSGSSDSTETKTKDTKESKSSTEPTSTTASSDSSKPTETKSSS